jgi:hypothetical protein
VTITCRFAVSQFPDFQAALQELSHGSLEAIIMETQQDAIMPLGTFTDSD